EVGDVADAHREVTLLADDDVADLLRFDGAAFDAQRGVLRAHLELTAWHVDVRARDRALDLERRYAGRGEPDRVEVHVDLTFLAAEDHDLPDALQTLDALLDGLVGEARELARRHAGRAF